MLVLVELALLFGIKNQKISNCAKLCSVPQGNGAALLLLVIMICHMVPTHFFLYSFYIIPRKFYATEDENIKIGEANDSGGLNQPLLQEGMILVEDDINWHKEPRNRSPRRTLDS